MTPRLSSIKRIAIAGLFTLFAAANVYAERVEFKPEEPEKETPERLKDLYKITKDTHYDKDDQGVKQIRLRTLQQAAFSWGVQEVPFWRYQKIVELMEASPLSSIPFSVSTSLLSMERC